MAKILLIDDESIFHFLTKKMLEISGISGEIISASNGKEALSLVEDGFLPEYIFVDLDMPYMNGLEFVEAYRKRSNGSAAKIVVLSSSVSDDERKNVLAAGADAYLSKPLEESVIQQLIPRP